MKKIFIFILIICPFLNLHSQTIKGYIFSAENKKPVEFANVLILNLPDSSLKKGVVSYTDGQYTADKIPPGKYYIKSTCIGFRKNGIEITVPDNPGVIKADTIFLYEKTNQIEEVKVTGDMIRGKELVDRTVYDIPPEIEKTSTNGYDVLKKIPSVQVDFNNNVTLDGGSNFIIQVDGKQRDKEFLARLLPTDIKSIEIIHNPSGKYDGTIDGVINVILKQEARNGINGNFGFQAKPIGKPTVAGSGSIDYGLKKITFYISGYSFIQRLKSNTTDYYRMTLPVTNIDSTTNVTGEGEYNITGNAVNTGFDYYMNDNNSISLNYSYRPFVMENDVNNSGSILVNNVMTNYQKNYSRTSTNSGENNISFFYRKKFKKPIQELTVETNYYFFNSKDNNDFTNNLYENDRLTELYSNLRWEKTDNNRDYFSNKIDYTQPIGVSMRLETGYQIYYQHINYNYKSNNEQLSNTYNYSEFRNAAYASMVYNYKDLGLQGTVRVEGSNIKINKTIPSDYITILPSANIQYKFSTKHNVKFTYNRRINRPGIYNLNPFEKLNYNLSISAGNPYLKPEYRDRLQMTYTVQFKKNFISPYIYYQFFSNKIDNKYALKESPLTDKLAMFNSPANILTGNEKGIGLSAMMWYVNINGAFYSGHYNRYSDSLTTIDARNYQSYRITSYAYAPLLKKKLNVYAYASYNGVNINAQSKTYNVFLYALGATSTLKNHTFGFIYLLPFSKDIVFRKTITETPFLYSKNTFSFDASWFIQVMYSYRFNKGRTVKKSNRNTDVESDTKGGGLGR